MNFFFRLMLLAGIFTTLLTACGEAAATGPSPEELAAEQTAFDAMMEGHDLVMPRMGEINQLSRALRAQLDSASVSDSLQQVYTQALSDLEAAEDGMMEWMGAIQPLDSLRANGNHTATLQYLQAEKAKVDAVADQITSSIERAQALVNTAGEE